MEPEPASPPDPARFENRPLEEIERILQALQEHDDNIPDWEFCEGFLAALVCCRRPIAAAEFLPVLLGAPPADAPASLLAPFSNSAQQQRFLELWQWRVREVQTSLVAKVESLADPQAYDPLLDDVRGLVAELPPEERAQAEAGPLPSFAQLWAAGFLEVVEVWSEEWTAPRDKETAQWLAECLAAIDRLVADDPGPFTLSPRGDEFPPSMSAARGDALGDALLAVYDLHDLWNSLGPRADPVRRVALPGRNEPCWCGSGKKFKRCHGA